MSQIIPYSDQRIRYLGRWIDSGAYMHTGWTGGQIRFKISGAISFQVMADCKVSIAGHGSFCPHNINLGETQYPTPDFTTPPELGTFTDRTVTITLPDMGEHTIILKPSGYPVEQFAEIEWTRFKGVIIPEGATLSAWPPTGAVRVLCAVDSWNGTDAEVSTSIDGSIAEIYPVAFGGAKASELDALWPYAIGTTPAVDPKIDFIYILVGINDTYAGVSRASFYASLNSAHSKIRASFPSVPILLLTPPINPGNIPNGLLYNQYAAEMATVAASDPNTYHYSLSAEGLVWADFAHLTFASRQELALSQLGPLIPYVTVDTVAPTLLTGRRTEGAAVTVACPTAATSAVFYPTEKTWAAAVSGFAAGDNVFTVEVNTNYGKFSTQTPYVYSPVFTPVRLLRYFAGRFNFIPEYVFAEGEFKLVQRMMLRGG